MEAGAASLAESTQHVLSWVRPPRVQITYDVEIGGAIEKKELPFIVGIMADLSGKPAESCPRSRTASSSRSIATTSTRCWPRPSRAWRCGCQTGSGPTLTSRSMSSSISGTSRTSSQCRSLKQVPALSRLYEARQRLRDLLTKLDGNDELDALLAR